MDAPAGSPQEGATVAADMLHGYGVTHVFMVPAIMRRTFAELERLHPDVARIATHGEKSAAYMADGYARASGRRPGVCAAQAVGALNLGRARTRYGRPAMLHGLPDKRADPGLLPPRSGWLRPQQERARRPGRQRTAADAVSAPPGNLFGLKDRPGTAPADPSPGAPGLRQGLGRRGAAERG
jgi:Thiamine pyrophosphate enzyme, N-terminal TPP binding domain